MDQISSILKSSQGFKATRSQFIFLFSLLVVNSWAQFIKLHDFTDAEGTAENTGVFPLNGYLYGTTRTGGTYGAGTFFSLKEDGSAYTTLLNLDTAVLGAPSGGLAFDGTYFYGCTGPHLSYKFHGTVFKIKPDGTGFSKLQDLGEYPLGSLVLKNDTLYGVTYAGYGGMIYKMKTDGSGFQSIHSFSTVLGGVEPRGGLMLNGNTLFGFTHMGGTSDKGIFYKLKTDGTAFSKLYDFTDSAAMYPVGIPQFDGTFIYGVSSGSTKTGGTIFRFNPDGTGFTKLYQLAATDTTDGFWPWGGLKLVGATLYGTTRSGGNLDGGTLFRINTDGSGFSTLFHFDYMNPLNTGTTPRCNIAADGHSLYGTTFRGGQSYFQGILYKFGNITGLNDNKHTDQFVTIFPNPSNGQINIKMKSSRFVTVALFDMLGRKVYEQNIEGSGRLNTLLEDGIYTLVLKSQSQMQVSRMVISE